MANSTDFDVTSIPFGGEGPGLLAMLGNEVDSMPAWISGAAEQINTGTLRALPVINSLFLLGILISRLPIWHRRQRQ